MSAYHVRFPDDAVDLFQDQNNCDAEENVEGWRRGGHGIPS